MGGTYHVRSTRWLPFVRRTLRSPKTGGVRSTRNVPDTAAVLSTPDAAL